VNDSTEPGHGPPYETPHLNTGTLLDYEKAYGSDPHTRHTGLLDYRPHVHRSGSSPHVPGEFPGATPDKEHSGPILGGAGATSGITTTGPSTSHDLRHTGSLNDPASRSTDSSGHHVGRDAAIAGGIGAAGLGAAATHHHRETPATGTGNLYDEKNPYSSKALDPRVTGGESRLDEQRFDPAATPSASRSQPLSGSSAPIVPPKAEERQHHYGRDAAIGGGALGAGALAGSALSGDRHHDTTLKDSSSLPTTQHTTGTTNPSTVGTTSTTHQLPSATTTTSTTTGTSTSYQPTSAYGEPQPQHHYGRDAGLAGAGAGVGAATAAGLAHSGSRDQPAGQHTVGSTTEDPASKTIGPHKSNIANILDPRVQPDPTKQKEHTTTGPHQSDMLNKADPRVDDKASQHHYGRDAAVAGGAGAAGYGAYEAAKSYGDHRSTQPGASMQEQRYDPTAAGARASNPVPATSEYNYHNPDVAALASATGAGAPGHHTSAAGQTQQPYTTAQLAQSASSQPPQAYKDPEIDSKDLGPTDNSSRNTALGAGAGLAGASAVGYGLSHHGDRTQPTTTPGASTQPGSSSLPQPTGSLTQGQQYSHNTDPSPTHTGRDAALVGGAGAAAGAGAGYAYGQRTQPQFDPKEQEKLDKETAKHQHELEKKHEKEVHKLEKEHEKDLKKHEKHEEKEEKKSGGLLGFLHRDKSKKEKSPSPESSPRSSQDRHYGRDAAVAGGVGAGAAGLAEHEREDKFGHGSGYKARISCTRILLPITQLLRLFILTTALVPMERSVPRVAQMNTTMVATPRLVVAPSVQERLAPTNCLKTAPSPAPSQVPLAGFLALARLLFLATTLQVWPALRQALSLIALGMSTTTAVMLLSAAALSVLAVSLLTSCTIGALILPQPLLVTRALVLLVRNRPLSPATPLLDLCSATATRRLPMTLSSTASVSTLVSMAPSATPT
jgi:hypothetical protein